MIFSAFERLVAFRYLRARREEGFVSVIAAFSLAGIAHRCGNAHHRHVGDERLPRRAAETHPRRAKSHHRQLEQGPLTDYPRSRDRLKQLPGVQSVSPMLDGQVFISADEATASAPICAATGKPTSTALGTGNRLVAAEPADDFQRRGCRDDRRPHGGELGRRPSGRPGQGDLAANHQPPWSDSMPRIRSSPSSPSSMSGCTNTTAPIVFIPLEAAQIYFNAGHTPCSDIESRWRRPIEPASRPS